MQEIDANITGRTSISLCGSQKRYLLCSNSELFDELSRKFPSKRTLTVKDNTITACEK